MDRTRPGRDFEASSLVWEHRAHREAEPCSDTWDGRTYDSLK